MSVKGFYINGATERYDYNALDNKPDISGGLTAEAKQALLACFENVAWVGTDGQTYYDALAEALNTTAILTSIVADFNQGGALIYNTDSLSVLRNYLTVTAAYSDGSSNIVDDYTLSGALVTGTSIITASYEGKTATFPVTVTATVGTYSITNALSYCTTSNEAATIAENETYSAIITANSGYTLSGAVVSITMGGTDVTGYYNNGTISIPSVTGDLVITVTAAALAVQSISAVFSQGDTAIYPTDSLASLKQYLAVTATYQGGITSVLQDDDYSLSGTLTVGTSAITVSYSGLTTTFTVTVSEQPDVPTGYTQVEYVERPSSTSTTAPVLSTGLTLTGVGDVEIDIGFMCTGTISSASVYPIASRASTSNNNFALGVNINQAGTELGVFSGTNTTIAPNNGGSILNTRYDVTATVTDTTQTITDGTNTNTATVEPRPHNVTPFWLFGAKKYNVNQLQNAFPGRIYYCTVKENGETKLSITPCTRDDDGAAGFYDKISGNFLTADVLVAGPAV